MTATDAPVSPDETIAAERAALFTPFSLRSLELPNRIVMSPMTRSASPEGVPGEDVASYYARRAAGGTGLVVTEGVAIEHETAVDDPAVPRLHGEQSLAGWRSVVDAVHAAGGRIAPQLWHVGPLWGAMVPVDPTVVPMRPSGRWGTAGVTSYGEDYVNASTPDTAAMTADDCDSVIAAYAAAARTAAEIGFDAIALHGGHGYLLDAFMWDDTNHRDDLWGGDHRARAAFPAAVVAAIRAEIGEDLPILFRFSQHKQQDYTARLAQTPDQLEAQLGPLADAGVDLFDASARAFDAAAFDGSDLSLAGWAKKLTGRASMAVGSVGMATSLREARSAGGASSVDNLGEVIRRLEAEEFDLIAIGRLHLADPQLATTLQAGAPLPSFSAREHATRLT